MIEVWIKRDLTLLGKGTTIKSLIFSQFTYYLAIPLTMPTLPSKDLLNKINSLIFNFLWGCKQDKIKRDVITRTKQDFIISLEITLFGKIFCPVFTHPWTKILIQQLKYPNQILVSVKSGVVSSKYYRHTRDILICYSEWKSRTVTNKGISNHCVWGNKNTTGIWNKVLWNDKGIIFYISLFIIDSPRKANSYVIL